MSPNAMNHSEKNSDDIDFFQLCAHFWQKKALIVIITLFITIAGSLVAFITPLKYKATLTLEPVKQKQLNLANTLPVFYSLSPEQALDSFYTVIHSLTFQKILANILNRKGQESSKDTPEKKQDLPFTFKKTKNTVTVTYESSSEEDTRNFLKNTFMPLAFDKNNRVIAQTLRNALTTQKTTLENHLALQQAIFTNNINKKISNLEQALSIAEKMGIEQPAKTLVANTETNHEKNNTEYPSSGDNLFLLGYKALKIKLDMAKNTLRKYRLITPDSTFLPVKVNDKPLIPGVAEDYITLVSLKGVKTNLSGMVTANVSDFTIDTINKRLVYIILSLFCGLISGLLIALVAIMTENRKRQFR